MFRFIISLLKRLFKMSEIKKIQTLTFDFGTNGNTANNPGLFYFSGDGTVLKGTVAKEMRLDINWKKIVGVSAIVLPTNAPVEIDFFQIDDDSGFFPKGFYLPNIQALPTVPLKDRIFEINAPNNNSIVKVILKDRSEKINPLGANNFTNTEITNYSVQISFVLSERAKK